MRAEKKMAKNAICNICNTRRVSTTVTGNGLCDLCRIESEWENAHGDYNHEARNAEDAELRKVMELVGSATAVELRELAKGRVANSGKDRKRSEELRAAIVEHANAKLAENATETAGCWECHPELNEAQKVKKTRRASEGPKISRKGQKITVPLIAPGEVKAAVVIAVAGEERAALKILGGGVAVLDVNLGEGLTLHLAWDAEGRYDYPEAYVAPKGGKKKAVRNVAEALRIIRAALAN